MAAYLIKRTDIEPNYAEFMEISLIIKYYNLNTK
jgi:hypothetical protein